ncbi:MAG: hypothetical protein IJH07_10595 [Ruminococcus sp.]|nr:hypothetical protein [Ruminococcus sp.]
MKKAIFLPILLILTLLLSSCGEPPTLQSDFSASFTTNSGGVNYAGIVEKDIGTLTVTLSQPYTVEGTSFCWKDSTLTIEYAGHAAEANADYLPADTVPSILHNTLAYLNQATYTSTENDEDRFNLPTPYGSAEITAKDGKLLTLSDPHTGTMFEFDTGIQE